MLGDTNINERQILKLYGGLGSVSHSELGTQYHFLELVWAHFLGKWLAVGNNKKLGELILDPIRQIWARNY